MKKFIFTCLAVSAMTVPAHAEEMRWKPYIGINYVRAAADYSEEDFGAFNVDYNNVLEDGFNGMDVHLGSRFHKNFGLELGYFRTAEEDRSIAAGTQVGTGTVTAAAFDTTVQLSGFTLDAMGYMPIGAESPFELLGSLGVAYTKGELSATIPGIGSTSDDESEFGLRIGAGAQYNINEQFNVRGMIRYQTADFDGTVDNLWFYTAGINFTF